MDQDLTHTTQDDFSTQEIFVNRRKKTTRIVQKKQAEHVVRDLQIRRHVRHLERKKKYRAGEEVEVVAVRKRDIQEDDLQHTNAFSPNLKVQQKHFGEEEEMTIHQYRRHRLPRLL